MHFWCFVIALFYLCGNVISGPVIPCKITDAKCLDNFGPSFFARFFESDPTIGTESLDPMHYDVIEGNSSTMKFKLIDSTITGFKHCKTEDVKLNLATLGLRTILVCPSLKMYGNYDMRGKIVSQPVEGTGDYSITTQSYRISSDVELKIAQRKDGKSYIAVKNFRLKPEPLEPIFFDFKNLYNGQKDLADAFSKFAHENWKELASEVQGPVFDALFKKIIKNANKLLKSIPLEAFLQF